MTRQRTIALCDASAAEQFAPWSEARETIAVLAWNAVKRIDSATAAQEPQAVREIIEHLQAALAANQ